MFQIGDKVKLYKLNRNANTRYLDNARSGDTGIVTELANDNTIRISLDKSKDKFGWWYECREVIKLMENK